MTAPAHVPDGRKIKEDTMDMEDRIRTKQCEACQGLGKVPADPAVPVKDLAAELDARYRTPRPEFAAMVEVAKARQAGRA
jgi:hypothetical protein